MSAPSRTSIRGVLIDQIIGVVSSPEDDVETTFSSIAVHDRLPSAPDILSSKANAKASKGGVGGGNTSVGTDVCGSKSGDSMSVTRALSTLQVRYMMCTEIRASEIIETNRPVQTRSPRRKQSHIGIKNQ